MAVKWICSKKFPGVRWYEHAVRKHGVVPDKYFAIRFQHAGKRVEEGLGWASSGVTEKKAALILEELRIAAKTGEGHSRLADKRAAAEAKLAAEQAADAKAKRDALTFGQFWRDTYLPRAEADKKHSTMVSERALFSKWIEPAIGSKPMKKVAPLDLERMKKAMSGAKKSPRTIKYALDVTRQVFAHAKDVNLFEGDIPTAKVKPPREDNRRQRFLTHNEAERLLAALCKRSKQLHDISLLSLQCGLRFGEIATLTWGDVDFKRGHLHLRDTKSGRNRCAYLTARASTMLADLPKGQPSELVFVGRNGKAMRSVSHTFDRVVNELGLNEGVADRRQRVVFHTLRHTYASWLVERGVDLFAVKELLGHSCIDMTQRYSHLAPDSLRRAVDVLESKPNSSGNVVELKKSDTAG